MRKGMINKWAIIGVLWFAIVLLTFLNISKINRLQGLSNETEALQMDQEFWQRHAADLEKLVAEGKRLYLTTDSLDMGLLILEHRFKTISMQYGIPIATITRQQGDVSDNEVPIGILFAGNLNTVVRLLKSIQKEMPYLKAKKLKINVDPVTQKAVLDALYLLRYKTKPEIDEPKASEGT